MFKLTVIFLIFSLITVFINSVLAHVCDDVLRYDPINIRTDVQVIRVIDRGEFKIFLKNNYADTIHNVKVIPPKDFFDFEITPTIIEKVLPGQEVYFLVSINIGKDITPGIYPLVMKIGASEFTAHREVQLTVKLEREEAEIEIQPKDVPLAVSAFPSTAEVEPGKSIELKVFLRHDHIHSLHNVKLFIGNKFEVNIFPAIIEEIKPSETIHFLLTLKVPEAMEEGDYLVPIEVSADEFPIRYGTAITVRVGEVKKGLTYLYFLFIVILIGLLIWRKIGIKNRQKEYKESF